MFRKLVKLSPHELSEFWQTETKKIIKINFPNWYILGYIERIKANIYLITKLEILIHFIITCEFSL